MTCNPDTQELRRTCAIMWGVVKHLFNRLIHFTFLLSLFQSHLTNLTNSEYLCNYTFADQYLRPSHATSEMLLQSALPSLPFSFSFLHPSPSLNDCPSAYIFSTSRLWYNVRSSHLGKKEQKLVCPKVYQRHRKNRIHQKEVGASSRLFIPPSHQHSRRMRGTFRISKFKGKQQNDG